MHVFGWSTLAASYAVGTDTQSFGFGSTGFKSFGRKFIPYGKAFSTEDVVGCFLNLDGSANQSPFVSFSLNGEDLGIAYEIPESLKGAGFYPSVCMKDCEGKFVFGKELKFPPKRELGWKSMTEIEKKDLDIQKSTASMAEGSPVCLIVEPSRELAQQVYDQLILFTKHMPEPKIRISLLVGGSTIERASPLPLCRHRYSCRDTWPVGRLYILSKTALIQL